VEIALIEYVMMEGVGEGAGVEKLLRIHAGRGRCGDVADVIDPRTFRCESKGVESREYVDEVAGRDLADLDVGARRDGGAAVAEVISDPGESVKLRGREFSRGNAAAEHEAVLGGRHMEQAVVAKA